MTTPREYDPAGVLEALKRAYGLSDQKLADIVGMSRKNITDRRRGRIGFDFEDLTRICDAFNLPFSIWVEEPLAAMTVAVENMPADLQISPNRRELTFPGDERVLVGAND